MKKKEDAEIRISPKMGKWKSLGLKLSSLLTVGSNDGAAGVKPGKPECLLSATKYTPQNAGDPMVSKMDMTLAFMEFTV